MDTIPDSVPSLQDTHCDSGCAGTGLPADFDLFMADMPVEDPLIADEIDELYYRDVARENAIAAMRALSVLAAARMCNPRSIS